MKLDRKTIKKLLFIITFTVFLLVGVQRLDVVLFTIHYVIKLFMPFIIGGCIAFIVNLPMRFIETKLLRRLWNNKILNKCRRPISMILSLVFLISIIGVVSLLIIPEFIDKLGLFLNSISSVVDKVGIWINDFIKKNPQIEKYIGNMDVDWTSIGATVTDSIRGICNTLFTSTFSVVSTFINSIINLMISFMFAMYLLARKEELAKGSRQLLYAYVNMKWAKRIHKFCSLSYETFSKFISGQCIEALIQFGVFLLLLSLLRFPYPVLISVFIAFMSLIPIFGSYISSYTSAFLILMSNPLQALLFLVLFMVVQQLDSSFIYPKVVGNAVGLPAIWVIVAVSIGGRLLGIVGMVTFIPLVSVCYTMVKEHTTKRLERKNLTIQ